jgi:hypothetical protein
MPEKLWDEMSVDEKLGVLRTDIQWIINAGNKNNALLDERDDKINQRLAEVEEKVNKVLTAVQKSNTRSLQ